MDRLKAWIRGSHPGGWAARLLLPVLCAVLLLGPLTESARAVSSVTAQLRPDFTIIIDGSQRIFYNVAGQQVHPLSYQDTTYLPVRAIGELMGKTVSWNPDTKTVDLSGVRTGGETTGTPDPAPAVKSVTAELREDFIVTVDGTARTFTDAAGRQVYPLLYQGSTYLPIRAIGELMGKTVSWDGDTRTITLTGSGTVTDADVIAGGTGPISLEEAKAAALDHAGLTAAAVTFTKQKLELDHGRQVYEIEFYTRDYAEYDYEIDAGTGRILEFDHDAESYTPPAGTPGTLITQEKAREIALGKVPGATASHVRKLKLDDDDGRQIYEIEIIYKEMEYDLEISAADGTVLEFEAESIYD